MPTHKHLLVIIWISQKYHQLNSSSLLSLSIYIHSGTCYSVSETARTHHKRFPLLPRHTSRLHCPAALQFGLVTWLSSRQRDVSGSNTCPFQAWPMKPLTGIHFFLFWLTGWWLQSKWWEDGRTIVSLNSQMTTCIRASFSTTTIADLKLPCISVWVRNQLRFWWTIICLALFVTTA